MMITTQLTQCLLRNVDQSKHCSSLKLLLEKKINKSKDASNCSIDSRITNILSQDKHDVCTHYIYVS